jgi:hypothetical protein
MTNKSTETMSKVVEIIEKEITKVRSTVRYCLDHNYEKRADKLIARINVLKTKKENVEKALRMAA